MNKKIPTPLAILIIFFVIAIIVCIAILTCPKIPESNTSIFSTLGNPTMDEAVINFLLSQQQFSWKTEEGSTNFCVFQNLHPESDLFPVYIWIRCGEFKIVLGELKELSGTSLPVKIDYPNELSYYDLTKFSFEAPRDGSLYDGDIKRIFPKNIWSRLNFDGGPFLNQRILEIARESLLNQ